MQIPFVIRHSSFVILPLLLASCADWKEVTPTRNFDELIPRFMGALKTATPEEAASNLFNVTSPDERRDAVAYLQTKPYGHEAPYMRAYQVLTTDPHPMVRAQAMRALGSSKKPADAVSYLIKGMNDSNTLVRNDAANALITTYSNDAIPALAAHVLDDEEAQVRINSARALIHFQTPEATRALISALDDRDPAVAFYAHESLSYSTGQNFNYDVKAWLTWYQQNSTPATTSKAMP